MGEVNGSHAAEIAVRSDRPEKQAQPKMARAEEDRAQDTRLDEDNAAHVVLRNPILAAGHLAQQPVIDRRLIVGRSRAGRAATDASGAVKVRFQSSKRPSPSATQPA